MGVMVMLVWRGRPAQPCAARVLDGDALVLDAVLDMAEDALSPLLRVPDTVGPGLRNTAV